MRMFSAVFLLLVLLAVPLDGKAQSGGLPDDLRSIAGTLLSQHDVPGLALAVVKDGEVLYAGGFGVRSLEAADPVDAHSLFGIASNTKLFTATALALLVEEGLIQWDAPVIEYLPWFRLSDPYVTAELTVRDLLVHRSGLAPYAGDLLWWPPTELDRRTISERLRFIPLATSFRSTYAYDNVLYTVAGEVIKTVSGLSWEDFVQTRILDVVGMGDSNVLHSAAGEGGNVAMPHARVDGTVRRIAPFASDNTNPAGGVNASAADMAKWMTVQLDSGRVATGRRLFSPSSTAELWSPVTPIRDGKPHPLLAPLASSFHGYALGLHAMEYRGEFMLAHGGVLPGYFSRVAMIPEKRIGVAVMLNGESEYAHRALVYTVLDALLGLEPHDWVGAYGALESQARAASGGDPFAWPPAPSQPVASRSNSAYAATYRDAWYGEVFVEDGGDGLRMRFEHSPSLVGDLVHWDGDTFIARWDDRELRADAYVTFVVGPSGVADSIVMSWVSEATDVSYDFHDLDLRRVR